MEWLEWRRARRRAVQTVYDVVGGKAARDALFDESVKLHDRCVSDVDGLGAGLADHVRATRELFQNAVQLAEVLRASGPQGAPAAAVHDRWLYLHATVRRSANKVVVDDALDPLRAVVRDKTVRALLNDRAAALLDLQAFERRIARADPKAPSAKLPAKLAAAQARYAAAHDASTLALRQSKASRDAAVRDAAVAVLATQAEFAGLTADCVEEASNAFPDDEVERYRAQMRLLIDGGGPPLVDSTQRGLSKVASVLTGKKSLSELRKEATAFRSTRKAKALKAQLRADDLRSSVMLELE